MNQFLRSWQKFDVTEVGKHLMILGDSNGDCASCRELGINPWKAKECPQCHTAFQFIASRRLVEHPGERFSVAHRVHEARPDLQMIDYDDYQKTVGADKARDFFKT